MMKGGKRNAEKVGRFGDRAMFQHDSVIRGSDVFVSYAYCL